MAEQGSAAGGRDGKVLLESIELAPRLRLDVGADGVAELVLGAAGEMPGTDPAAHAALGRLWGMLEARDDLRCLLVRSEGRGARAAGRHLRGGARCQDHRRRGFSPPANASRRSRGRSMPCLQAPRLPARADSTVCAWPSGSQPPRMEKARMQILQIPTVTVAATAMPAGMRNVVNARESCPTEG